MPRIPAKYVPSEHENRISAAWKSSRSFHADPARVVAGQAEPYCVLIPPPNVTAALHLGHALNNTLQDVLVRAARMQGKEAMWMPGTDHAGIATQTVVEKRVQKEEGRRRTDFPREEFVAKIQAFKDEYEATITGQLVAMGCSCDWERQRFTMDSVCARAVRQAFFQLFKDGLIERGKRLVNWDPVTQTALADDEVEMEEVDGNFYYLRYPLVRVSASGGMGVPPVTSITWGELARAGYPGADQHEASAQAWITVATTRPETYLGDTAVAINPKDPRAAALRGLCAQLPIVGRVIPILEDNYVVMPASLGGDASDPKAAFATGFLKVTPAHDPNDYELGMRHREAIEATGNPWLINVMAPDASISDRHGWTLNADNEARMFVGLSREEARKRVVMEFKRRRVSGGTVETGAASPGGAGPAPVPDTLCEAVKPYRHSVGHSYRSHAAIEPYLSDQWYVMVNKPIARLGGKTLRELTLEVLGGSSSGGTGVPPVGVLSRSDSLKVHQRALPHWQVDGATYFITFRLAAGTLSDQERTLVLDACGHFHGSRARVYLACVMPDHVHLLLTPLRKPEGSWHALPELLHSIKSFTAHEIQKRRGASGQFWQTEYYDRIVRDQEEFLEKWEYIANNPLKAGWVGRPEDCSFVRSPEQESNRSDEAARGSGRVRFASMPDDGRDARPTDPQAALSFHPERYAKTYQHWNENLRDWCISRQLWWGHRIPVWSVAWPTEGVAAPGHGGVAGLSELHAEWCPLPYATHEAIAPTLPEAQQSRTFICLRTEPDEHDRRLLSRMGFEQDSDVLDTWFSSALWPLSTMGWPDPAQASRDTGIADFPELLRAFNPTNVLCTAREIITLWVSRMVMFNRYFLAEGCDEHAARAGAPAGSALGGCHQSGGPVPFHDVFIHAMIQDGQGRKMSKSLGNGVDPLDIIATHGADAMRFVLCQMATHTQDVRMPVEKDERTGRNTSPKFDLGRNFCTKLWNAARFTMMQLEESAPFTARGPLTSADMSLIDRWIIARLAGTIRRCEQALREYQFSAYATALYDLLWRDYCDWYLEAVKPTAKQSPVQQAVLRAVLDGILRLLHPVAPFITEAIWEEFRTHQRPPVEGLSLGQCASGGALLCRAPWPGVSASLVDEAVEARFARIQAFTGAIREARSVKQIEPKKRLTLHVGPDMAREMEGAGDIVRSLAGLDAIVTDAPPPSGCAVFTFEASSYSLSGLGDAADAQAEIESLKTALAKLDKDISVLEARLNNPGYADKAPAKMVQQSREQLAQKQSEREALRARIPAGA